MIERKKKICLQCGDLKFLWSHGRCQSCDRLVSISLKKQKTVEIKTSSRGKAYDEVYLWPIFSLYIRLRDSDKDGIGRCFTCNQPKHYRQADCGHGIGRQHKSTKYNEKNNHLQDKRCNGFEAGRADVYQLEVDKKYGAGTWDNLLMQSRQPCKRTHYEYDLLTHEYCAKVVQLAKEKGIDINTLKPVVRWISKGLKK